MATAVDTNILLDVFQGDENHREISLGLLREARHNGDVLVCEVVYAELVPSFETSELLDAALRSVNASISPMNTGIAYEAGLRWGLYRRAGGPRTRILSDFLIGAHALLSADAFLTRDQGFYRTYFPELVVG